jgi:hypothetical protein
MNAQVSAYMNYIDQRLTTLDRLHGLMHQNRSFTGFSVFYREAANG